MARRPIFTNEVIADIGGDFEPQYDIIAENGTLTGAKLTLKNNIFVQGTPQNADNMNNLFDFDNLGSMAGNTCTTVFNPDGSVTETIKDTDSLVTNAVRSTAFPGSNVVEATTVYDDTGLIILRQSTKTTTFNVDGSITEAIT